MSTPAEELPAPLAAGPGAAVPAPPAAVGPADPPPPGRWLWVAYPVALLGINAVWGAVLQVLLGRQVAELVGPGAAAAGTLGAVISVGAVSSLIAQPLLGRLSDRTSGRFLGRRNVWVLGSAVAGAAALVATGLSGSTVVVSVLWAVAMWPLSGVQAALTAVLPERIPVGRRGAMSGIAGTTQILGAFVGVAVAGQASTVSAGYLAAAVLLVVPSALFALTTRDPSRGRPAPARAETAETGARFPTFRSAPDFWWTFISRFLVIFAFQLSMGFQLYTLRDYIRVGDGSLEAAQTALVGMSGISTVATLLASLLAGFAADRLGRLKPFVFASALIGIPASVVILVSPTYTGALVTAALTGLGMGAYLSVDQALISRVIPSLDNAARDLGLINIANAGPQVIAPVIAGAIVAATGRYELLYVLLAVFVVPGALAVLRVRSVR
jgi:MFS family permease